METMPKKPANEALTVLEEVAIALLDAASDVSSGSEFDRGRSVAYYEALSSIVSQCQIAGIELSDIRLGGFVPESILSPSRPFTLYEYEPRDPFDVKAWEEHVAESAAEYARNPSPESASQLSYAKQHLAFIKALPRK